MEPGSDRRRPILTIVTSWMLLAGLLAVLVPMPVDAAPVLRPVEAEDEITFRMTASQNSSYPGKICVGEEVEFNVKVQMNSLDALRKPVSDYLLFLKVTATPSPSSTLKLISQSPTTTTIDEDAGVVATFTFKGKEPGSATIYFDAMVPARYLSSRVREGKTAAQLREMLYVETETYLQVLECPLEFKVLDRYDQNLGEYHLDMVGVVNYTVLKAVDSEGKEFYADATKYIVLRQFGGECKFSLAVAQRAVEIRAQKREDGGFHIEYTQGPARFEYVAVCDTGTGAISTEFADPGGTDLVVGPDGGDKLRRIPAPGGIVMWSYNRARPIK